jgi:hypothetical protein
MTLDSNWTSPLWFATIAPAEIRSIHTLRSDHLPGYGSDDSISRADDLACSIGVWSVHECGHDWSGEVPRVPKQTRASPVHREICCASFSIIRTPRRGLNDLVGATAALAG